MQIWNRVKAAKPAEGSGLTREQFGVALRLVAYAQTVTHPTPEAMEAAASSGAWRARRGQPLPAPQLLPDARSALCPPIVRPLTFQGRQALSPETEHVLSGQILGIAHVQVC